MSSDGDGATPARQGPADDRAAAPAATAAGQPPTRSVAGLRRFTGKITAPLWLWSCTHVGTGVRTLGRPRVVNRGRIEVRDNVVVDSRFSPVELVTGAGGSIVLGEGTVVEHGTMLVSSKLVELGDGVTIGPYCVLSDTDGPEPAARIAGEDARPIWVGDGVVVGARVTVLPGAVIGAGSHILPGSMVSGEIPSGVVAGGNPARSVRKLPTAGEGAAPAAGTAVGVAASATTGGTR